ncbi:MAG TPA: hypothetical protein VK982_06570 [Bacteroidales bacterium]|nr:hypothetical protein [Bacteroidales bacterium]
MKMRTPLLAAISLVFLFAQNTEAQIWKKIKKKTQDKVENVIVDKTSDKAAEITAKKMDQALNADFNLYGKGAKKEDISDLPKSYSFEWKYQLKMKAENPEAKEDITFDYYLAEGQPYFGFSVAQMPSMFTVIDQDKNVTVSYMEQEGSPVALAYQLPETQDEGEAEAEAMAADFTVTELPDKVFLGYESKGLQFENSDQRFIVYIAKDTPVSFAGMYDAEKGKKIPDNFKNILSEQGKKLMMYAKIIDKNDSDNNMEMECISLEEAVMVKQNSNYKFM